MSKSHDRGGFDCGCEPLNLFLKQTAWQRQGFGKILLIEAMTKFVEIFNTASGIGLFIDAKDHEAKLYYQRFGFVSLPANEIELFLPVKTIQEALR